MRIGLILTEALGGLRRNISMVISVILVTFVSLTFVGAAILMQSQIGVMRGYWAERAQVAVYMCSASRNPTPASTEPRARSRWPRSGRSSKATRWHRLISSLTFDTKEDTYAKLVEQLGEDQASVLTPDQAFEVFFVTMKDPGQSQVLAEAFSGQAGVEQVKDQLQYLEPLFSALTVATYIAVGIAVLMLIAATLLIGTTIRLSAYAPSQGDRHHAPGRRLEPVHPDTVRARRRVRGVPRLGAGQCRGRRRHAFRV